MKGAVTDMKQNVIIAGAGISAASPSNLPSWWEYNKKLIAEIKEEALKLCPEAADILKCIDAENKLPVQCISQLVVSQGAGESYFPLLELLDGTVPNANHFALVELARLGLLKAIVTTNFDTLIETAFRSEVVPLYTAVQNHDYYEAAQITTCKLFKIHGSVHDNASLIDTVSQKAVGLSPEKRMILENIFSDSDIFVIGFSGADLDFDLDYIPLARAIESGSRLTWVIRPGSVPNSNVEELQRRYPQNVLVCKMELQELFVTLGVQYKEEYKTLSDTTVAENEEKLTQRIKELFSSSHIGAHGCMGYCLTLLDMIGASEAAEKLAEIYEEKLDWSTLNVFSVLGVNALARQKAINRDWQGAVRGYQAVIQCHQHLNKLNRELQKTEEGPISPEQSRRMERECAQNLSAAYLNLGNVYYYMTITEQAYTLDEAEKYLELAQSQIQKEPDILYHSMVSFGLARVKYLRDHNYDRYLDALHISKEYAQKEGRLDTLVEILLEECRIRMQIGEYYLARNSLDLSLSVLKNVGRITLTQMWETLNKECQLRTGEQAELLTEEALQTLISGVEDCERKAIIYFEAKRETEYLAPLFNQLCIKYMKKRDWQRLWDVGQCCHAAARTDSQRLDALYTLGCAATEQTRYWEAKRCFDQIVDTGMGVNDLKLGWAHSELARLSVRRGDVPQAIHHFNECILVLQKLGDLEQLTQAAANVVADLFQNGQFEQAEKSAEQLLTMIDDSNAVSFQEYLEFLRRTYAQKTCEDIQNQPPHVIAARALRLYDSGDTKQAWEWMRLATEKYEEAGNLDGVGRCENNMGMWCQTEGIYEEAIVHLKAAMEIKFSLGDVGGGINQLSALLQIYTVSLEDLENAEKLAHYAEQNMPLYADKSERYALYYGLAFYKLRIGDYALALVYGKRAEEGLPYLLKTYPNCGENLRSIINLLEQAFACQSTSTEWPEFEIRILEAARLGKIGELDKCLAMVERLKRIWGDDHMKNGILEGTCANAFLEAEKYDKAIALYQVAIERFETVTGDDRETAANHRLTAVNGISIALAHLGREEEAITLIRKELEQTKMSYSNRCLLTVNQCNRLIALHQNTMQRNDSVFTEVCDMLDSLTASGCPNHEEQGNILCVHGLLYMAIGDNILAKRYYQQAKKEFLIVNSRHIAEVDQVLTILDKVV